MLNRFAPPCRTDSAHPQSDLDHRVVAWIAEAYLVQGQPERARAVVDEFLPEFQLQGVAEGLMVLRVKAQFNRSYFNDQISNS